ncbi:MAG: RdgB/HAM1 family non-canonical purine NTP pyrophosphatase [bacterium]
MKLLFASRNRGKLAEVNRLLAGSGWQVMSLDDLHGGIELVENGSSFEENARMKARQAVELAAAVVPEGERDRFWVLADDSGLEVDALGGEPGVRSARYAGPGASDADRTRQLIERLAVLPAGRRTARFRCAMCLVAPGGAERLFEGRVEGSIAGEPRGAAGFGYDPVFVPGGYDRTFAELGLDIKNQVSHRAAAMRAVVAYLATVRSGQSA